MYQHEGLVKSSIDNYETAAANSFFIANPKLAIKHS
jgi:hypothetical protein